MSCVAAVRLIERRPQPLEEMSLGLGAVVLLRRLEVRVGLQERLEGAIELALGAAGIAADDHHDRALGTVL